MPQDDRQKTAATQPIPGQGSWTETHAASGVRHCGARRSGIGRLELPDGMPVRRTGTFRSSIPSHRTVRPISADVNSPRTGAVYTGFDVAAAYDLMRAPLLARARRVHMTASAVDAHQHGEVEEAAVRHTTAHPTTKGNVAYRRPGWQLRSRRRAAPAVRFQTVRRSAAVPSPTDRRGGVHRRLCGWHGDSLRQTPPRGDFWAFKRGRCLRADPRAVVRATSAIRSRAATQATPCSPLAAKRVADRGQDRRPQTGCLDAHASPCGNHRTSRTRRQLKPHCATQFFEGIFNPKLNPGQSFQYTFTRAGEYFYNDCTDPRPTGKIVVY